MELPREKSEIRVEEPYFLVRHKCLRPDVMVMKSLCLLLVNSSAIICIVSLLLQLYQLKLLVGVGSLHVEVELLDCPQSLVF